MASGFLLDVSHAMFPYMDEWFFCLFCNFAGTVEIGLNGSTSFEI
jgi:hypothetical protein